MSYTNDGLDHVTLGSSMMANLSVEWTQAVPYPGKRRLAAGVAEAEAGVRRKDLETVRLAVLAAVKGAYVELCRVDRTRNIVDGSRTLLLAFLDTARSRYESGDGILENVLRAQTELTRLDVELSMLDQERSSAEARLGELLGRRAPGPFGPAASPLRTVVPDSGALEAAAIERAPEVLTRRAAVQREEKSVDLAKRDLKPDFFWSAAYRNRGGLDPLVMGGFGVRLPIYRGRKQEQAVAQAESELAASRDDADAATAGAVAGVRDLIGRAEAARRQKLLFDEGVVPQAHSTLDAAATSYAAGHADFATLIGDFLALLDAERGVETARAAEASALARLEPLTGAELVTAGPGGHHE